MNWLVALVLVLKRTSLILTGRTLRILAVVVSDCFVFAVFVHSAFPVRKPAPVDAGELTRKVAVTLAPGTSGVLNATDVPPPEAEADQPDGTETLSLIADAAAPVVFVNVSVTSCVPLGVNVVIRDKLTRCTS